MKLLVKQKKEDTVCYVISNDNQESIYEFSRFICFWVKTQFEFDCKERTITFSNINADKLANYIESHCIGIEIVK